MKSYSTCPHCEFRSHQIIGNIAEKITFKVNTEWVDLNRRRRVPQIVETYYPIAICERCNSVFIFRQSRSRDYSLKDYIESLSYKSRLDPVSEKKLLEVAMKLNRATYHDMPYLWSGSIFFADPYVWIATSHNFLKLVQSLLINSNNRIYIEEKETWKKLEIFLSQEVLKLFKRTYSGKKSFVSLKEDSIEYALLTRFSNEINPWELSDRNENQLKNDEWYWGKI